MRPHRYIDLNGKVFGRLTVMHFDKTVGSRAYWKARCECGTMKSIRGESLRSGVIVSCGCFHKDNMRELFSTHRQSKTPEYWTWIYMRNRCENPNHVSYKNYGGRGIKVCTRWRKFKNFIADMGRKPSTKHSLERINVDKGYAPSNCKWATLKEQARNTRRNRRITYQGKTLTVAEWAEVTGYGDETIRGRAARGLTPEKIFAPFTPRVRRKRAANT